MAVISRNLEHLGRNFALYSGTNLDICVQNISKNEAGLLKFGVQVHHLWGPHGIADGWPWPSFQIHRGRWPVFNTCRFPHNILRKNEAGPSNLVCRYITLGASMGLYVVDLDPLSKVTEAIGRFSILGGFRTIYLARMKLGCSNFGMQVHHLWGPHRIADGWPWPTFQDHRGHWPIFST